MFLNKLDEESKKVFLQLAYYVAKCDESISNTEETLISQFRKEIDMPESDYNPEDFSLVEAIAKITNKEYQKIILMELMAIVYADNVMHVAEKEIIDTIVDEWCINSSLAVVYGEWAKGLLSLYTQGEALLELN